MEQEEIETVLNKIAYYLSKSKTMLLPAQVVSIMMAASQDSSDMYDLMMRFIVLLSDACLTDKEKENILNEQDVTEHKA